MPDYQLHTLSHQRFERLVNRVCTELLGIGLSTFAEGADQGIDGAFQGTAERYPSEQEPWSGYTIVQAKHTSDPTASCEDSSFKSLLKTEAKKVSRLHEAGRCDNYLLVTNRKLPAKTCDNHTSYLRDETGIDAAGLIGIERLTELLERTPAIVGEFQLLRVRQPEHWTVPHPRNPYFKGRGEVLADLRKTLTRGGSAALGQAISGLGGVGKTQTAVEYAWRHREDYDTVLWVPAETPEELRAGWVDLASRLDLEAQHAEDDDVAVHAVLTWLEANDGWLLVLDNADDPEILLPFLPPSRRGHLLVTSRASSGHLMSTLRLDDPVELAPLALEPALEFLLARTGRHDLSTDERHSAERLAEDLGYLPLALEQAAAYLLETSLRFTDYREAFISRRAKLLASGTPPDYKDTVATTWTLNIQRVAEASPSSRDL
ncbi:MAG: NB-ARC domain-containing protein, partial [Thermoanaerobaculia bacterium]